MLGAAVVGMVGWPAFLAMMAVLGLLVATLLLYEPRPAEPAAGLASPTSP